MSDSCDNCETWGETITLRENRAAIPCPKCGRLTWPNLGVNCPAGSAVAQGAGHMHRRYRISGGIEKVIIHPPEGGKGDHTIEEYDYESGRWIAVSTRVRLKDCQWFMELVQTPWNYRVLDQHGKVIDL